MNLPPIALVLTFVAGVVVAFGIMSDRAQRLFLYLLSLRRGYEYVQATLDARFKWKVKHLISILDFEVDVTDAHIESPVTIKQRELTSIVGFCRECIKARDKDNDTIPSL